MKGMITTEEANDTPRDDKQPHKKGEDTPEINTVIDSVAKEVEPTQDNPKTSNDGEQLTKVKLLCHLQSQWITMIEQRDLFYIFLCVSPEYFDTRDKWVNRYRKLMSMVKEGKLPR